MFKKKIDIFYLYRKTQIVLKTYILSLPFTLYLAFLAAFFMYLDCLVYLRLVALFCSIVKVRRVKKGNVYFLILEIQKKEFRRQQNIIV